MGMRRVWGPMGWRFDVNGGLNRYDEARSGVF